MYKINKLPVYAILCVALFLHLEVLGHIRIFGAKPDLMLACVVFFGLFSGAFAGLHAGLFAGILQDVFALDFFGINTFILGLTGLLAGVLNTNFFKESKRTQCVLVFSFTAFSMILHYAIASLLSKWMTTDFAEYLFGSVVPTGIYTGLVAVPMFSKFIDMFNLRELEELL